MNLSQTERMCERKDRMRAHSRRWASMHINSFLIGDMVQSPLFERPGLASTSSLCHYQGVYYKTGPVSPEKKL